MMNRISHSSTLEPIPENSPHCDNQHETSGLPASTSNSSTGGVGGHAPSISVVSDTPAVVADRDSSSSTSEASRLTRTRRKRRFHMFSFYIALTLLVILAIILVVFLGPSRCVRGSDSGCLEKAGGNGSVSNPGVSYTTPAMIEQVDVVLSTISSHGDLTNKSTPQYKARDWLITQDLLLQDVLWEGVERLSQRYIAELIFWALTENATQYLQPDASECDWPHLTCPEREQGHVLTEVVLNQQSLRGTIPDEIFYLSTLQHVDLSKNKITGTLSGSIRNWHDLFSLDISENDMSGTLPEELWALPIIRYVYLGQNRFVGQIRTSNLSVPSELVDVWIHDNDFTGLLPQALFENALRLQTWTAYGNRLSGPLPDRITSQSLSFFDVSYNNLNGTLDALNRLLSIPALETMYLDNNQFGGTLPDLKNESQIMYMWIQGNQLSGTIPSDFGLHWRELRDLRIQSNNLRGNITTRCSSWPLLSELHADCRVRRDGGVDIECNCCNDCF